MQDLGYTYKRQREEKRSGPDVITPAILAEAVLAAWREQPAQAKFRRKQHFDRLYDTIFKDLNAAQAILAVLIFRAVENKRKHPSDDAPDFLPYASHYLTLLIGQKLLRDQQIKLEDVSHKNFQELSDVLKQKQNDYYKDALESIQEALTKCYGGKKISLQQLSATFRGGYLQENLLC